MVLLDTHALIWFLANDPSLSEKAMNAICSEEEVAVSCVSLWEIAIKKSLKKLDFQHSIAEVADMCKEENINILPMSAKAMDCLMGLPFIHRDPFDRYIIATAITGEMPIVTRDSNIVKYDVKTIW